MSGVHQDFMREWSRDNGKTVGQGTVRQETQAHFHWTCITEEQVWKGSTVWWGKRGLRRRSRHADWWLKLPKDGHVKLLSTVAHFSQISRIKLVFRIAVWVYSVQWEILRWDIHTNIQCSRCNVPVRCSHETVADNFTKIILHSAAKIGFGN